MSTNIPGNNVQPQNINGIGHHTTGAQAAKTIKENAPNSIFDQMQPKPNQGTSKLELPKVIQPEVQPRANDKPESLIQQDIVPKDVNIKPKDE